MRTYWQTAPHMASLSEWQSNCWIQVTNPTDSDADYLEKELGIPDSFLPVISDIDERSRVDGENGWTLIILRIPYEKKERSRSPYITLPLGIIMKGDICITVCYYATNMMDDFILHYQKKEVISIDPIGMVFRFFLSSAVWYLELLEQIKLRIGQAKHELDVKDVDNKDIISLSRLQDCLTYFMTSMRGNETLLAKLRFKLKVREKDKELIEDTIIEMQQARESAVIYSNILDGTMDTYASIINNNMNTTVRTLTAISIIPMFPTLVASIYGMNVPNGWESYKLGFVVIVVVSVVVTVLLFWFFRHKHWI